MNTIGKHMSTTINKKPQWLGSTSDTYIKVYRKMCIQEEILHGGNQHAKRAHTFTSSTYSGRFGGDCCPPSIMRASIQFPPPSRKSLTTIHFPSGTWSNTSSPTMKNILCMCVHTYIQEQNSNAKSHIPSPRPTTTVERGDTVCLRGCREWPYNFPRKEHQQ